MTKPFTQPYIYPSPKNISAREDESAHPHLAPLLTRANMEASMTDARKLSAPQPVRPAQVHDPEFVNACFTLTYLIHTRMEVPPSEWSDYTFFLADFVQDLGVDAEELERIANLDSLHAPDDLDEDQTARFYARLYDWQKRKLCRRHTARRAYVSGRTREWFLTTMTVLKAAFPDVVRHRPIWNSARHRKTWKRVKAAWAFEKERLTGRLAADD